MRSGIAWLRTTSWYEEVRVEAGRPDRDAKRDDVQVEETGQGIHAAGRRGQELAEGIRPGPLRIDLRPLRADLFLVPAAGGRQGAVRQLFRLRGRRPRRPDEDPGGERAPDP